MKKNKTCVKFRISKKQNQSERREIESAGAKKPKKPKNHRFDTRQTKKNGAILHIIEKRTMRKRYDV
jgi:hypothetical protein